VNGIHQVRPFLQQPLPLAYRLLHQRQLSVFQIAQAAVNDAGRTAGDARSEVVLLDQQRALPGPRAFARQSHAIDAAADDYDLEVLIIQGRSRFYR
jgi:hypothetical protein